MLPASIKDDFPILRREVRGRPLRYLDNAATTQKPKAVLDAPEGGCVNVHASLLPRWRGAAPIQRAILAGDETTGVTIMRMEEGLDTGPMLLKRETMVDGKTAGELTDELAMLGAEALVEWLSKPSAPVAQPDEGVTYASKIDKAEARIDWSKDAAEIERQVRAFAPAPGAWFEARWRPSEAAIGQLQLSYLYDTSLTQPAPGSAVRGSRGAATFYHRQPLLGGNAVLGIDLVSDARFLVDTAVAQTRQKQNYLRSVAGYSLGLGQTGLSFESAYVQNLSPVATPDPNDECSLGV